jgi:SAM-dependent methyltransferase
MVEHATDFDWATHGLVLERGAEVQSPLYLDAFTWARSAIGGAETRLVVDIGAGPGVFACLLATTFPSARVIAVDGSPELLDLARARAGREGVGDRVETHLAELPEGLESADASRLHGADLVWTSHVLHHLADQEDAVRRVARLLRPGGLLAVAEGGLPTRTLPRDIGFGRPGLEARLDAADEAWFAEMRAALPSAVPTVEHWPRMFDAAGLRPVGTRTFLLDLPAPLADAGREHVRRRFERFRHALEDSAESDDLAVLDQLLDDASPQGVAQRDDLYLLTATTVHLALAP